MNCPKCAVEMEIGYVTVHTPDCSDSGKIKTYVCHGCKMYILDDAPNAPREDNPVPR